MALRTARGERPDPAARLRALTRRAYTAGSGHLDFTEDAGLEFDRIIRGEPAPAESDPAALASRVGAGGRHLREDREPFADGTPSGPPHRQQPADDGPDEQPPEPGHRRDVPSSRRWAVSARAGAVVLAVVGALTAIIVIRSLALGPGPPVAVPEREQGMVSTSTAVPSASAGPAADAESGADPSAAEAPEPSGEHPAGTATGGGTETGAGAPGSPHPGDAGPGASPSPVVHVAGAVTAPGIVELSAGARVAQAIEAAGGATSDAELAAVNLARPVTDGEQVYVPRVGEVEPGTAAGLATGGPAGSGSGAQGTAGPPGADGTGDVVDLNTADQARLETLPGVGPAIAGRILDWRGQHGSFHSVEELLEVSGIGPSTLERLRDRVRV